jgi:hypothetical protein
MGWTVLPQPHYSLCLVPSDFHLFVSLKDALRERRYVDETQRALGAPTLTAKSFI